MQRRWWFPELSSEHGASLDFMFMLTLGVTGVLFLLLQLILAYCAWRYRECAGRPARSTVDVSFEKRFAVIAAVIVFVVDVSISAMGEGAYLKAYGAAPANSLLVEVTGEQFVWQIRYPGKDGQFGATAPHLVSATNPLGLNRNDPAAQDDIVSSNEMRLPLGRPVKVRLLSHDVIHSFSVPQFRVKQDAVPGMAIDIWFVPNKAGDYEIVCNQICGLAHYRMRGFVKVESSEAFEKWLNEFGG
ncbi:MAG: cytochrome-c oxidase [Acidobacteria bacterium]|nr:cytochrome-c oxidase [Acidobacteriota bacterium]